MRLVFMLLLLSLFTQAAPGTAQSMTEEICPAQSFQARGPEFEPGGIILTTFDGAALWIYDIELATRYPLPETVPCSTNCHLSPDARWFAYMNPQTSAFMRMRLDGTQRSVLATDAADVMWWNADTLLVWTPDQRAYLRPENGEGSLTREYLDSRGVLSIQPGGRWGVRLQENEGIFRRVLVDLSREDTSPASAILTPDTPYFSAMSWSGDGAWLAYIGRGPLDEARQIQGAELYLIRPGDAIAQQMSRFSGEVGAVRIDGRAPGSLSWSPASNRIAFWVTPLTGPNIETDTQASSIHVLDVASGRITRYCGYTTTENTPNPPRLIWSPDGTHLALGGNLPGDDKGYLLLALNLETGVFTELSDGIFPAMGAADVTAWGLRP